MDTVLGSDASRTAGAVDSGPVSVRPIGQADLDDVVSLHRRLTSRTLLCRYLTPHPDLSPEGIARLAEVDGHDRVALAAVVGKRIVGIARYERSPGDTDATVTLVADDPQCDQGVDLLLLQRLAAVATGEGVRRLVLMVSPVDRDLIETLDDSAFAVSRHLHRAGMVTITLHLGGPG